MAHSKRATVVFVALAFITEVDWCFAGENAEEANSSVGTSDADETVNQAQHAGSFSDLQYTGRNVGSFVMQLQTDYPEVIETTEGILSWPKGKMPETPEEGAAFLEAVTSARVFLDNAANWIFQASPPATRNEVYTTFFQKIGRQLPRAFYDAASTANPEVTQFFNPGGGSDAPESQRQRAVSPWRELRAAIATRHGPITNMPDFAELSDGCPMGDNKRVDINKATQDVVYRVMRLLIDRLSSEDRNMKDAAPELTAFCAAAGVFVASWQQHQQTLLEDENAPKAHKQLVTKLKNAHKYILPSYKNSKQEDSLALKQRKKDLQDLSKGNAMKHCIAYIVAAGAVATQSYTAGAASYPARSLYGGVANTLQTKLNNVQEAILSFQDFAASIKKKNDQLRLGGLCAALLVSTRMKKCFSNAARLSTLSIYHMHLDGATLLKRVNAVDNSYAPEAVSQYMCDADAREGDMDEVFRRLMTAVSTTWETENMNKSLSDGEAFTSAPSKGKNGAPGASASDDVASTSGEL